MTATTASPRATLSPTVATVLAATVGIAGGIQPSVNTVLADALDSALFVGWFAITSGLVLISAIVLSRPSSRVRIRRISAWETPLWTYASGISGALIVTLGAVTVGTIGVALFTVALTAGQMTSALFVDKYALAGGEEHPITLWRLLACAVALGSVVLSQLQDLQMGSVVMVLMVYGAGALTIVQNAALARMNTASQDRFAATFVNFSGAWIALTSVLSVSVIFGALASLPPLGQWPAQPWMYTGGVLGVVLITCVALSVPTLGVVRMALIALAAQLSVGLLLDVLFLPDVSVGVFTVLGVLGVFLASALASRKPAGALE